MEKLIESALNGNWRSYKSFRHTGEVKEHSKEFYQEYSFENCSRLTITHFKNGTPHLITQTENWAITFRNKKHYIEIKDNRLEFEIITANHVALVLLDPATEDKYFFARPENWENYVKPNGLPVL